VTPALARPIRIVMTGGECTGKTTLAGDLASRFAVPWLPEASRLWAEQVAANERRELVAEDVEPIARLHAAAEDVVAASGPRALVLDADLLSTVVYARHYYGACPAWIESEARRRLADLYLLHRPDLPWISDGVRDRPAERAEIHRLFASLLEAWRAPTVEVRGAWPQLFAIAEAAVEALLRGSPIGPWSPPSAT